MRVRSVLSSELMVASREPRVHSSAGQPVSLSEADAARYLGMSRAWLKKSRTARFRGTADAPSFVKAGVRRVVYRRVDLEEWQRQHTARVGPSTGAS